MAEPSERDREMATEISAKLLSRWANDAVFERFKREISEGLATVRAEGRREATEPYSSPFTRSANATTDRDRALANQLYQDATVLPGHLIKTRWAEVLTETRMESRREAIEECAKMADEYEKEVLPVDPGGIARLIAFRCRALAKSIEKDFP